MPNPLSREPKPILCYVTDRRALGTGRNLEQTIRRAAECGVDWIQIREKDLDTRPLLDLARRAAAEIRRTPAKLILNDRLDVALAADVAGVHLGENSLPVKKVAQWRRSAGRKEFLLGASCHSLASVLFAEQNGADYAFFGPVFPTPAKLAFGPPQGIERLREACGAVRIPVLAIGGVTSENGVACLEAGAAGIAAIRLFQQDADIAAAIDGLQRG